MPGYYGYDYPYYGYGYYRPYPYYGYAYRPLWLLRLWLEARHNHRYRAWLGLALLNANSRRPSPIRRQERPIRIVC
jgi:hypothetical protein